MLLAVDVGTTVLKAALFRRDGTATSRAERPLVLIPDPDPVRHETDARGWIRALREVTGDLGLHGAAPLAAVVVSGNNPTLVPAAADGAPLANAITWMDRRSTEEARWIAGVRGCPTDASHFLPKALWLQRNRPEVYERARWFFSCPEYVVFMLTGTGRDVPPDAAVHAFDHVGRGNRAAPRHGRRQVPAVHRIGRAGRHGHRGGCRRDRHPRGFAGLRGSAGLHRRPPRHRHRGARQGVPAGRDLGGRQPLLARGDP